jgi:Uma2 family endonuclease
MEKYNNASLGPKIGRVRYSEADVVNAPTLIPAPLSIPHPGEPDIESILPKVELIESDGVPMESDWHVRETHLLLDIFDHHCRDRNDCYYAGNMFLYYSEEQARNRDFKGPDFFFVANTHREPRRLYWATWLENNRTPDVVVELSSPTTVHIDHGEKKDIYERVLRVPDYFCYDPTTQKLDGWRLDPKRYRALSPNDRGWLWSEELQLWVGAWRGFIDHGEETWLRFFDIEGRVVPTPEEYQLRRANLEEQRAEQEKQRAEQEKQLRLSLETELAQMRDRLAAMEHNPSLTK